jgi:creatinine amidohydrolase/Fe(II)-dependent formamide hydrolase-like protein
MKRSILVAPVLLIGLACGPLGAQQQAPQPDWRVPSADLSAIPNPIAPINSVWMEELTVLEMRDAIRSGMTTALIITGGVEENGPYTSNDQHNVMARATGEAIARRLGNALVAPVVRIHQGNPETQALAGSIVLTPETFRAVIRDYATSLKTQGFKNIFVFGEDGGSQTPLDTAAKEITAAWGASATARVAYIPEYYREDPWSCDYLRQTLNIQQQPVEYCSGGGGVIYHDDYHYSAIIATVAPEHIRVQQRRDAGLFSVNGVDLDPLEKTTKVGWDLLDYRADITVRAIRKAMGAEATQAGR